MNTYDPMRLVGVDVKLLTLTNFSIRTMNTYDSPPGPPKKDVRCFRNIH